MNQKLVIIQNQTRSGDRQTVAIGIGEGSIKIDHRFSTVARTIDLDIQFANTHLDVIRQPDSLQGGGIGGNAVINHPVPRAQQSQPDRRVRQFHPHGVGVRRRAVQAGKNGRTADADG